MFIELTDHLRCPADHDEAYLVLLPGEVDGRSVRSGTLGCPVCDRRFAIRDGRFRTADASPLPEPNTRLAPTSLVPLVGLDGPGGYFVLVGAPATGWREVAELVPGVALVGVNPPADVRDEPGISVVESDRLPLKTRSMRGVVLGRPYGDDPVWVREAARVVLPGLRVAGEGSDPSADLIDVIASADGVWVGTALS